MFRPSIQSSQSFLAQKSSPKNQIVLVHTFSTHFQLPTINFLFSSSIIELCQAYIGDREGNSGLSVLRTFRLLRILKLVRFMPNLRRQLFVMLRTMDNVAIFFSLLILFIFIFR
jgi:Ion transport protein